VRTIHRVELCRHIDDAAPALLDHRGRDTAGHLVGGDVVGLDHGPHDVVGYLPEFLRLGAAVACRVDCRKGEARIVDEDVRRAEPLPRRRDDTIAISWPPQIGDKQDLPSGFRAGRRRLDLGDIRVEMADRDDIVSLACEAKRHRAAETT
jgi:hypothetical protein